MDRVNNSPLSRYVLRTSPGKLLIDLFPPGVGMWGELAHLWELDTGRQCGLTIPEVLITQQAEPVQVINPSSLSYLVLRDKSPWRKTRLAHYLLEAWGQSVSLSAALTAAADKPPQQLAGRVQAKCAKTVRRAARKLRQWRERVASLMW